jgi:hypothetical protein
MDGHIKRNVTKKYLLLQKSFSPKFVALGLPISVFIAALHGRKFHYQSTAKLLFEQSEFSLSYTNVITDNTDAGTKQPFNNRNLI